MAFALPNVARLDPLPRYSRDPETASFLSSAPSYTSAAPSYHSNLPSRRPSALFQAQSFAPGFTAIHRQTVNPIDRDALHQFNIVGWTQTGGGGTHARQLNNVAHRRATMALERGERDARNAMSRIRIAAQERLIAELDTVHGFEERETANYRRQIDDLSVRQRYDIATSDDVSEVSTLRDDQGASTPLSELRHIEPVRAPTIGSLVDTAIAVIEREQREARSLACSASGPPPQIPRMLQRSITIAEPETTQAIRDEQLAAMPRLTDEELFKQENKSWNFMLAQMHDWNERERSWARFRETLETKKGGLLARRLGLKKRSLSRG